MLFSRLSKRLLIATAASGVYLGAFESHIGFAKSTAACKPSTPANETCKIKLEKMHPTQFSVGQLEVDVRAEKFQDMSQDELKKYFKKHAATVVVGPGEIFYVVDGHHRASALWKIGESSMPATIAANLSDLTNEEFEKEMVENHWTWLLDENGQSGKTFADLPSHVEDLADNPYRSLAWLVRQEGGYAKSNELWGDFLWSEYFRAHLTISKSDTQLKKALKDALKIVHLPAARNLPGYISKP